MSKQTYLFLDDKRLPADCISYMQSRRINPSIYLLPWQIVRSYDGFVNWIEQNGLPDIISFDHDLEENGKRGIDAAKWLVNYCLEKDLALPQYIIHSMNPVGAENINALLENYTAFRQTKKQPGKINLHRINITSNLVTAIDLECETI